MHWPQWWATLCRSPTEVAHGRHDDHGPFFPLASLSSHAEMLQRRWHAQRSLFWMYIYIIVYDFVRWGCYANDSWLHMQRQPKNCCCYVEDFLNDLLYSAGRLGGTADSNELLPAARPKMTGLGWLGCMSQFCQFLLLFRVVSSQHVFILVQPKCFLISEKYFWYIFHLSDFSPGGIWKNLNVWWQLRLPS